jgi:hypothetical protein
MTDAKPLGRIPSPDDPRDFGLRSLLGADAAEGAVTLPTTYRVSTTQYVGRFDQQENSCVGQSLALAKIVQERKNLVRYYPIEPLWIWDRAKERDGIGSPTQDRGTYIRSGLEVLLEMGAALSRSDNGEGRFKIASYLRLTSVYQVKLALYTLKTPVIFGSEWYDSWFTPKSNGMLPLPDQSVGGHAFDGDGWANGMPCPDGSVGAFHCPNSWGEAWGYRGDFWLPFTMFGDGKPADEAWKAVDSTIV